MRPAHGRAHMSALYTGLPGIPSRVAIELWPGGDMRPAVAAGCAAVLGMLLAGCGGSSNTADYRACKAIIKADMAKSLSAVSSGQLPQNLPTAAADSCSHLSKEDMTRLMHEVTSELQSRPPTAASGPATAASGLHLPGRLLGLKKSTSPRTRAVVRANMSWLTADRKDFRSPQGAAYFGSNGREIEVLGAMFTGPDSIAAQVPAFDKSFVKAIVTGPEPLRPFPAGSHGGALYCAHANSDGPLIACVWADKAGTGEMRYLNVTSSLSDAASKTNQIRAVIEP